MARVFGARVGPPEEEPDVHEVLAVERSGDSVKITARFEGKSWRDISSFARGLGYIDAKEALPILFSYGVSEKKGVDIEKRRREIFAVSGSYAAMKFEAYQLFADNRALSMALSTMLPENKRLRELVRRKGLPVPDDEEWSRWDQGKVDSFHAKYVFPK